MMMLNEEARREMAEERDITCTRCGEEEPCGLQVEKGYYCSRFCMLEDNPQYVKSEKDRAMMARLRKQGKVKTKMRALKKEAEEAGVPWS